jgi:hypothetical protein
MLNPIYMTKIFPVAMILMALGAAAVYFFQPVPDIRRCIYWIAGAVITATVTF